MSDIYLVFGGKTGWIGKQIVDLLTDQGKTFYIAESRTENRQNVTLEIEKYNPTHVINAAGVTGRPNVDWCEDHRQETIRTNVIGCLNLADICETLNIHHLLYATGCIFEYDETHVIGGNGFLETDTPNFHGSYYSHTKAIVEDLLKEYSTTCILRVRMPISDDLNPRNFITKIVSYEKVVNIPNSMTILSDLLPISLVMAERKLTGIYNFCNPGAISHNEVLDLYIKYIDSSYTYTNFTLDEQSLILKSGRSNNTLDEKKLVNAIPDIHIPEVHESMNNVMQRMKVNLEKDGIWPNNLPKRD